MSLETVILMGKQMTRIQRQRLERILALRTEIDDNLEYMRVPPNNRNY